MGLLNFVGGVLRENAERINQYKMHYDGMDDERLLRLYRGHNLNTQQRMAIIQLLHERGYGTQKDE